MVNQPGMSKIPHPPPGPSPYSRLGEMNVSALVQERDKLLEKLDHEIKARHTYVKQIALQEEDRKRGKIDLESKIDELKQKFKYEKQKNEELQNKLKASEKIIEEERGFRTVLEERLADLLANGIAEGAKMTKEEILEFLLISSPMGKSEVPDPTTDAKFMNAGKDTTRYYSPFKGGSDEAGNKSPKDGNPKDVIICTNNNPKGGTDSLEIPKEARDHNSSKKELREAFPFRSASGLDLNITSAKIIQNVTKNITANIFQTVDEKTLKDSGILPKTETIIDDKHPMSDPKNCGINQYTGEIVDLSERRNASSSPQKNFPNITDNNSQSSTAEEIVDILLKQWSREKIGKLTSFRISKDIEIRVRNLLLEELIKTQERLSDLSIDLLKAEAIARENDFESKKLKEESKKYRMWSKSDFVKIRLQEQISLNLESEKGLVEKENIVIREENKLLRSELECLKKDNLDFQEKKANTFSVEYQFKKSVSSIKQMLILWHSFESKVIDKLNAVSQKIDSVFTLVNFQDLPFSDLAQGGNNQMVHHNVVSAGTYSSNAYVNNMNGFQMGNMTKQQQKMQQQRGNWNDNWNAGRQGMTAHDILRTQQEEICTKWRLIFYGTVDRPDSIVRAFDLRNSSKPTLRYENSGQNIVNLLQTKELQKSEEKRKQTVEKQAPLEQQGIMESQYGILPASTIMEEDEEVDETSRTFAMFDQSQTVDQSSDASANNMSEEDQSQLLTRGGSESIANKSNDPLLRDRFFDTDKRAKFANRYSRVKPPPFESSYKSMDDLKRRMDAIKFANMVVKEVMSQPLAEQLYLMWLDFCYHYLATVQLKVHKEEEVVRRGVARNARARKPESVFVAGPDVAKDHDNLRGEPKLDPKSPEVFEYILKAVLIAVYELFPGLVVECYQEYGGYPNDNMLSNTIFGSMGPLLNSNVSMGVATNALLGQLGGELGDLTGLGGLGGMAGLGGQLGGLVGSTDLDGGNPGGGNFFGAQY